MSILMGKNVLVIGDENTQIHNLEELLVKEGATIHNTTCGEATIEGIEANDIDFIFLNHLHAGMACESLLNSLRQNRVYKVLPIFALVEDEPQKIEHALMLGAADYVTSIEDVPSIIQKIKTVFGDSSIDFDDKTIDITPESANVSSTGSKILVIEDDPLLRNLLALRLEKSGFAYEFSENGLNIIEKTKKCSPKVIVLDLMLPEISGIEVLRVLKSNPETTKVPVVVFTNSAVETDRTQALELGANCFFVKALTDLSTLVNKLEELSS